MLIFLAHGKANYLSDTDGYVLALRAVEWPHTLYSFVALQGKTVLPNKVEDEHLSGSRGEPVVDGERLG